MLLRTNDRSDVFNSQEIYGTYFVQPITSKIEAPCSDQATLTVDIVYPIRDCLARSINGVLSQTPFTKASALNTGVEEANWIVLVISGILRVYPMCTCCYLYYICIETRCAALSRRERVDQCQP